MEKDFKSQKQKVMDMAKIFAESSKQAIMDVVEDSRQFREQEAENKKTNNSMATIPKQGQRCSMIHNKELYFQRRIQSECSEVAAHLLKVLAGLPDYFNLIQPENSLSIMVSTNGIESFTAKLYKKDVSQKLNYSKFSTSLRPELQRRASEVARLANIEIETATFDFYQQLGNLDLKYSVNEIKSYLDYLGNYQKLCTTLNLVVSNNTFLTRSLDFYGFEDAGDYILLYIARR